METSEAVRPDDPAGHVHGECRPESGGQDPVCAAVARNPRAALERALGALPRENLPVADRGEFRPDPETIPLSAREPGRAELQRRLRSPELRGLFPSVGALGKTTQVQNSPDEQLALQIPREDLPAGRAPANELCRMVAKANGVAEHRLLSEAGHERNDAEASRPLLVCRPETARLSGNADDGQEVHRRERDEEVSEPLNPLGPGTHAPKPFVQVLQPENHDVSPPDHGQIGGRPELSNDLNHPKYYRSDTYTELRQAFKKPSSGTLLQTISRPVVWGERAAAGLSSNLLSVGTALCMGWAMFFASYAGTDGAHRSVMLVSFDGWQVRKSSGVPASADDSDTDRIRSASAKANLDTLAAENMLSGGASSARSAAPFSTELRASDDGALRDIPSAGQVVTNAKSKEDALALNQDSRREIQKRLTSAGFGTSGVDGIFGPRTRAAISTWQRSRGFSSTGFLDAKQLIELAPELSARQ